jgi:hypothetical protein
VAETVLQPLRVGERLLVPDRVAELLPLVSPLLLGLTVTLLLTEGEELKEVFTVMLPQWELEAVVKPLAELHTEELALQEA